MTLDGIPPKCLTRFAVIALLCVSAGYALSLSRAEASVEHHSHEWDRDDEADDTLEVRQDAGAGPGRADYLYAEPAAAIFRGH